LESRHNSKQFFQKTFIFHQKNVKLFKNDTNSIVFWLIQFKNKVGKQLMMNKPIEPFENKNLKIEKLESRPKAAARLDLEVSGWAILSSRGLWGGDAFLLSTDAAETLNWAVNTKWRTGGYQALVSGRRMVVIEWPQQLTRLVRFGGGGRHGVACSRLKKRLVETSADSSWWNATGGVV
jgi:hypothetical protein